MQMTKKASQTKNIHYFQMGVRFTPTGYFSHSLEHKLAVEFTFLNGSFEQV